MVEQQNRKPEKWKGYTLEEIHYQKALTLIRMEVQKERLLAMKNETFSWLAPANRLSAVWNKHLASNGTVGYLLAGYKLFRTVRGLYKKFRSEKAGKNACD